MLVAFWNDDGDEVRINIHYIVSCWLERSPLSGNRYCINTVDGRQFIFPANNSNIATYVTIPSKLDHKE